MTRIVRQATLVLTALALVMLLTQANAKHLKVHSKRDAIPSNWSTYVDKINGFSMRLPPGWTIEVAKSEYPRKEVVHIDMNSSLANAYLWGLRIEVIPNPKRLTAEAFYREKLAVMDKEMSGWGGSDDTMHQHPITIAGQRGIARQFLAPDSTEKEVTFTWGDKAYEIGYTLDYSVMADKDKRESSHRIKLLEMMISTLRPQEQRE